MDCRSYKFEIEEMEAGERPRGETAAHLSTCESCRAFFAERQSLRQLMGEMHPVAAPTDFDFRLRARLAASSGTGNHRSAWKSFVFSAPAIGLAASLVLLGVAATAFYHRSNPAPVAAVRPVETAHPKIEQPAATTRRAVSPVVAASPQTSPEVTTKNSDGQILASAPGATRPPRLPNGKTNAPRKQTPATPKSGQGFSNDYAVRGTPVITPYAGASLPVVGASPLVEVSVRSKSQPLKISLDDRSGVKRTVTLEPVVFGSQDLAGRETSRTAKSNGIW